jgi:hypothetical protein
LKSKPVWGFLFITLAICVVYTWTRFSRHNVPQVSETEIAPPAVAVHEESPAPEAKKIEAETQSAGSPAHHPPTMDAVKKEIHDNPHRTPPSYQEFAISLAPHLDAALKDEAKAKSFLKDLSACVLDGKTDTVNTIRALCIKNAQRLAEVHPTLRSSVEQLVQRASPAVQELAR